MVQLREGAYGGPAERGGLYALDQPIYDKAGMCKMEARKKGPIVIHLASSVRNLIERKFVSSTCDIGNFMLSSC